MQRSQNVGNFCFNRLACIQSRMCIAGHVEDIVDVAFVGKGKLNIMRKEFDALDVAAVSKALIEFIPVSSERDDVRMQAE